nr:immunoglobulin light chain junction region [Macaca mulatta]
DYYCLSYDSSLSARIF